MVENKTLEGQCQSYNKVGENYVRCSEQGVERIDNELSCGYHCEKHWDEMVTNCRQRSW